MNRLYRIRHPECYQSAHTRKPFFEGWFFKIEDNLGRHVLSVIPGVSRQDPGESAHPFVQGIAGNRSFYVPFDPGAFSYTQRPFGANIGPNFFSMDEMRLDLSDGITINGALRFSDCTPLRTSPLSPGIMGPLSYLPFMECRHGLLCLDAKVSGSLRVQDQDISFFKGRAYMEKDWGYSFPGSYIWIQSNRFSTAGISFVCAVATIPYLGGHFKGVFAVLHTPTGERRIASYNGGRLIDLQQNRKGIFLHIANHRYRLAVTAETAPGVMLRAPARGEMSRTVTESLQAVIHVSLTGRRGQVLFQDTGRNSGMEVCEPLPYPL